MARRAARIDENQPAIVAALRAIGCTVIITSKMGEGFPDLVVGRARQTYLLEVKDGAKSKSRRALTDDQVAFRDAWTGRPVAVVENVAEALEAVGIPRERADAMAVFERATRILAALRDAKERGL